jgi:hypothetical protein
MHPLYEKADRLSSEVIGAAIEAHRNKGPGLIESIYERCLLRELELRSIPATTLPVMSSGVETSLDSSPTAAEIVGDSSTSVGMTKVDLLIDGCLLVELKAVEVLHPFSKAQLFSRLSFRVKRSGVEKSLAIRITNRDSSTSLGMTKRPDEPVLKNSISRMILPGARDTDDKQASL